MTADNSRTPAAAATFVEAYFTHMARGDFLSAAGARNMARRVRQREIALGRGNAEDLQREIEYDEDAIRGLMSARPGQFSDGEFSELSR